MNAILRQFVKFGIDLAKQQVPQIAQVETIVNAFPGMSSANKQTAAIEAGLAGFFAAEGITGKDFAEDADFQRGVRMVNDGYVLVLRSLQSRARPPLA